MQPFDSEILLLGLKKIIVYVHEDVRDRHYSLMEKSWKEPKCPSVENKLNYHVSTCVCARVSAELQKRNIQDR